MTDTNPLHPRFYPRYPRLVCVESAYAGDVVANRAFLREALQDSLLRGEAPVASHAYLPDVLDDSDTEQRSIGLQAGHAWAKQAALIAIYLREGEPISRGVVERLATVAPAQDMTPIEVRVKRSTGQGVAKEVALFDAMPVVGRNVDLDGAVLHCLVPNWRDRPNVFWSVGMPQAEVERRLAAIARS